MQHVRGPRRWILVVATVGAALLPAAVALPAEGATAVAAHGGECRHHEGDDCSSGTTTTATTTPSATTTAPSTTSASASVSPQCLNPTSSTTTVNGTPVVIVTCTTVPTTTSSAASSTGSSTGSSAGTASGTTDSTTGTTDSTGTSTGTGTAIDPSTLPAGTLSWDSDFTRSGLSKLESLDRSPQNFTGAGHPALVVSPSTPGQLGLQFSVPGGGNRSEVQPNITDFKPGDDRWFGFSFFLPQGFPTDVTDYQLLTQWKNEGTGSPPLQLTVERGALRLRGGYGHPDGPRVFDLALGPAETGRRVDMAVHIVFSPDPATGSVDVFRDGQNVLAGYHPPGGTMYPRDGGASSYWKMGLYRSTSISSAASFVIERARVGTGYASVTGP